MILLLLACKDPEPQVSSDDSAAVDSADSAPPPVLVGEGGFTVAVALEWSGSCAFADPATYQEPTQEWTFDARDEVLVLYTSFWDLVTCDVDGASFVCDDGSWESGKITVSRRIEGSFPTLDTLEGARVLDLDCSGSGCETLREQYGNDLEMPCTAQAPFSGARTGAD